MSVEHDCCLYKHRVWSYLRWKWVGLLPAVPHTHWATPSRRSSFQPTSSTAMWWWRWPRSRQTTPSMCCPESCTWGPAVTCLAFPCLASWSFPGRTASKPGSCAMYMHANENGQHMLLVSNWKMTWFLVVYGTPDVILETSGNLVFLPSNYCLIKTSPCFKKCRCDSMWCLEELLIFNCT